MDKPKRSVDQRAVTRARASSPGLHDATDAQVRQTFVFAAARLSESVGDLLDAFVKALPPRGSGRANMDR